MNWIGCAVAFLLQKMRLWAFYWSRFTRLLFSLLFGMAVVVVPQVYAEMASSCSRNILHPGLPGRL
jgi:hypothetical protein